MPHREDTIGINPPIESPLPGRGRGLLRRRPRGRGKLDKRELLKLAVRQASQ